MGNVVRSCALVGLLAGAGAVDAAAQSWPRGFVSIGVGYRSTMTSFDDSFTFTRDQETGTTRVSYPVDPGPGFDAGGGVQLWRGLGVGVVVSRFSRGSTATAESSIPHPFFFQQQRTVSGETRAIRREETAVHVQAQFTVPVTRRVDLTLMAGPSFFGVNQQLVIDVNYTEEYPYDTAEFSGVDTANRNGSKTGFNAGADVRWMFTDRIGVGGLVRFTSATIDLDADQRLVSVDAGGVHIGAGIRIAF